MPEEMPCAEHSTLREDSHDEESGQKPNSIRLLSQKHFTRIPIALKGRTHKESIAWLKALDPQLQAMNEPIKDAKVYVFAEKYFVTGLPELALFLLHCELIAYDLSEAGGIDFVELVRYAYAKTSHQDGMDGDSISAIKALIMEYAA